MSIHTEINALGLRLGILKGQAYPLLPDARLVNCEKSVLSVFSKHKEVIAQMRGELDAIYSKLGSISKDVEGICVPELKVVYEGQIKLLHGERGALDKTLDAFDSSLSEHALLEELEESVLEMHNEVIAFSEQKIGAKNWASINVLIEDLLQDLEVVFPDSEKGSEHFCQKHYESKQVILKVLRTGRLDINWKKSELLRKSLAEANATLQLLFPALERLKTGKVQDSAEIQKLFASLPLELRMLVFAARNILPDDQFENTFIFDVPSRKNSDGWAEIRGLSHYDSRREQVNFPISVKAEQRKALHFKQIEAHKSLNKFVAQLPEEEVKNPQLLLEAFNFLHSEKLGGMTPAVIKSLETCLASAPELEKAMPPMPAIKIEDPKTHVRRFSTPHEKTLPLKKVQAPRPLDSQSTPILKSLLEIKEQIQAYRDAKRYDGPQREKLVEALLEAAENKGGVPLSVDQGMYYWVWFLAHEKDPSAGGEHFGKNHAPKDLDLLIAAIDKVMPPVPVITVEKVALPLRSSAPVPQTQVRRYSTPPVKTLTLKNAQAPKPSEVKNSPQGVKAPVMTEVKVKCLVPHGHFLTIRGEGGGLNWDKGEKLVKLGEDTYVHKMEGVAGAVKYKILLDDAQFETVTDRTIEAQKSEEIVPALVMPKSSDCRQLCPCGWQTFHLRDGSWNELGSK